MDAAVLVIDMQNGFVHPEGSIPTAMGPLPGISSVVEETQALLAEARAVGMPVVYTRHQWRPRFLDAPPALIERLPVGTNSLLQGTWDADICDVLAPHEADVMVDKNRFDAFLYTDMEVVLRALGVKRLLVTGVVTNVCVESTVRAAHMRDFEVTVASDCTAAQEGFHEPALASMAMVFAAVVPWRAGLDQLLADAPLAPVGS